MGAGKYPFAGQYPTEVFLFLFFSTESSSPFLSCHFISDDTVEKDKVKKAGDCCRKILNHVNQAVKESENKQVGVT